MLKKSFEGVEKEVLTLSVRGYQIPCMPRGEGYLVPPENQERNGFWYQVAICKLLNSEVRELNCKHFYLFVVFKESCFTT